MKLDKWCFSPLHVQPWSVCAQTIYSVQLISCMYLFENTLKRVHTCATNASSVAKPEGLNPIQSLRKIHDKNNNDSNYNDEYNKNNDVKELYNSFFKNNSNY